jgi:CheY-like chemotaxis protein
MGNSWVTNNPLRGADSNLTNFRRACLFLALENRRFFVAASTSTNYVGPENHLGGLAMLDCIPRVLIVDDEPAVRSLMADVLRMDGYQVSTARHGAEAVSLCEGERGLPDLLVTDIMMPPHMNGVELVQRLRNRKPDLKALFVSAYAGDPLVSDVLIDGNSDFLPKPLSPIVLSQRVDRILEGTPGATERDACRQRGTVLLSMADPVRRQWIRECLRGSGIWVLEAIHPAEAQFMGQWHEGPIHLLVTDPPKGGGPRDRWFLRLQDLRPAMEVLFLEDEEEGILSESIALWVSRNGYARSARNGSHPEGLPSWPA